MPSTSSSSSSSSGGASSSSSPPSSNAPANPKKRAAPSDEPGFYKKKKGEPTDECQRIGKHLGRVIDLFQGVVAVLRDGANSDPDDLAAAQLMDPDKARRLEIYSRLVELYPELEDRIAEGENGAGLLNVAKLLNAGRTDARTEDTSTLKSHIIEILRIIFGDAAVIGLNAKKKDGRGYDHDVTGFCLTPNGLDWRDPETRAKLQNHTCASATAANYANFMFKDNKPIPGKLWIGFLMSELLVRAYLCIFISPSSSVAQDPSHSRSNKGGNAHAFGMTEVTIESIAYVAMQVRFALSSENNFSKGGFDGFDYTRFYDNIITFLENPALAERVKVLLDWWNMRIFPSETRSKRASADQSGEDGTAALMLQQMLADGL